MGLCVYGFRYVCTGVCKCVAVCVWSSNQVEGWSMCFTIQQPRRRKSAHSHLSSHSLTHLQTASGALLGLLSIRNSFEIRRTTVHRKHSHTHTIFSGMAVQFIADEKTNKYNYKSKSRTQGRAPQKRLATMPPNCEHNIYLYSTLNI